MLGLHLFQIGKVQIDAIQEALGCHVCSPSQLLVETLGSLLDTFMDDREHLGQGRLLLLRKLFVRYAHKELIRDGDKGLVRPAIKPVKRAAVDQGWEHTTPLAQ